MTCKDCLHYEACDRLVDAKLCGWGIKNGKQCVIDEFGDFYELGRMVFLTKEEAQKEVKQRKKLK